MSTVCVYIYSSAAADAATIYIYLYTVSLFFFKQKSACKYILSTCTQALQRGQEDADRLGTSQLEFGSILLHLLPSWTLIFIYYFSFFFSFDSFFLGSPVYIVFLVILIVICIARRVADMNDYFFIFGNIT